MYGFSFIRTLRAPPVCLFESEPLNTDAQNHECTLTDASIPTSSILFHLSVKANSFCTSHLLNSQINEECRQPSESVRLMRRFRQCVHARHREERSLVDSTLWSFLLQIGFGGGAATVNGVNSILFRII